MATQNITVDQELLVEFIDESSDTLDSLDALFIELEQSPGDTEIVNAIFRPVHSIKGNSAFFGFGHIKSLAHEMETILDLVRKNRLPADSRVVSVLLKGMDALKGMFERVRAGGEQVTDGEAFQALVAEVAALSTPTGGGDGLAQVMQLLEGLLGGGAADPGTARTLQEALDTLKAMADGGQTGGLPEEGRTLLELLRNAENGLLDEAAQGTALSLLATLQDRAESDTAKAAMADCMDTWQTIMGAMGFDPLLRDLLVEKLQPLEHGVHFRPAPANRAPEQAAAAPGDPGAAEARQAGAESQKTMRVSEAHIDTFLAYVGELLVVGDMFAHLEKRLSDTTLERRLVADFRRANETFGELSTDLQKSIMSIRKVSAEGPVPQGAAAGPRCGTVQRQVASLVETAG
jgi:two-component system chemotaxis sensor kinase CheA